MPSPDEDDASSRGQISPEDREEIRDRASSLDRRLKDARGEPSNVSSRTSGRGGNGRASGNSGSSTKDAMGHAMRVSAEMVAGVLVGVGIGWLLDKWLGTWPAFFIVFFLLGAAAGMTNVVRAGLNMKTGPSDPSKGPTLRSDDDE